MISFRSVTSTQVYLKGEVLSGPFVEVTFITALHELHYQSLRKIIYGWTTSTGLSGGVYDVEDT